MFKTIACVNGNTFKTVKLSEYRGKYVVLFFYPMDFSLVCSTEITAFTNRVKEFRELGCEVLACSCDSYISHMEYCKKDPKAGGLGMKCEIPLLSDMTHTIAMKYGCLITEG